MRNVAAGVLMFVPLALVLLLGWPATSPLFAVIGGLFGLGIAIMRPGTEHIGTWWGGTALAFTLGSAPAFSLPEIGQGVAVAVGPAAVLILGGRIAARVASRR